jgi:ferrous iron transport protein B
MRVVALVGPPNVGKTTIMSRLCRTSLEVGNWAGVTVERRTCVYEFRGARYRVVDLPGTYSLVTISEDQRITRDVLLGRLDEHPDVIVVVADALNLVRGVSLLLEIAELGHTHLVLAVNMMDEAERLGLSVDVQTLECRLRVPVVPLSAKRGTGIRRLKRAIADVAEGRIEPDPPRAEYHRPILVAVRRLAEELERGLGEPREQARGLAIKLLEGDVDLAERLGGDLSERVERLHRELSEALGRDPHAEIKRARDDLASEIVRAAVSGRPALDRQARLDRVLVHPLWGGLLAGVVLSGVFALSFYLGDLLAEPLEDAFDALGDWARRALPDPWGGLLGDGVFAGVGAVLAMYPYILIMTLLLTTLEDTGYTARVAALLSGPLSRFGLHGKSVFPAALSLACNVPGVTGARIIDDPRALTVTVLALPAVPCSARLTVIAYLTGHLPDPWRVPAAVSIYAIALLTFLGTAALLHRLLYGPIEPHAGTVVELPRMRRPHPGTVFRVTWLRSNEFLRKAGTVILAASIAIWALTQYPAPLGHGSAVEVIGRALEPVTGALFGLDWGSAVALLTGVLAKETVVSTIKTLHLRLTPAQAYVLALVSTLYIPCASTIGAIYSETGSARLTALSVALNLGVATLVGGLAHLALSVA